MMDAGELNELSPPHRTPEPKIPPDWLADFLRRQLVARSRCAFDTRSSAPANRFWTTRRSGHLTLLPIIAAGARKISLAGLAMGVFEYRQAEEIRDRFRLHHIRYLFGKSGAILLGFPDTTQDADLFVEKSPTNCLALTKALRELGFALTDDQAAEIARGKDFVQLKNGPFDLDLVFAPDGIERFEDAWQRRIDVEGFPVCHIDDIIASKAATNRQKDRESLPRLHSFRDYLTQKRLRPT